MAESTKRNRKSIRLKDYNYSQPGAYFITICTKEKRHILSQIVGTGVLDGPQIVLSHYGKTAETILLQLNDHYNNISLESYVIMPNHIHLLLVLKNADSSDLSVIGPSGTPVPTQRNSTLSRFVSTFKRFCNKEYEKNIWQSRFYDHIIRNRKDFDEHLRYIYENPFRWKEDSLYSEGLDI